MAEALFRFHGELTDLVRAGEVRQTFTLPSTAAHWVESIGVPHTEVARIDPPRDVVADGDILDVYPYGPGEAPMPETPPRFIADIHAHTLARYLRMLGFDTLWRPPWDDAELAACAARERRILLTMDVGLLKRGVVAYGSWIRHQPPRDQLSRLMSRYRLRAQVRPLTRCVACNGVLAPASLNQVHDRIPAKAAELHRQFYECPDCHRVYWEGSHHRRMRQFIDDVTSNRP